MLIATIDILFQKHPWLGQVYNTAVRIELFSHFMTATFDPNDKQQKMMARSSRSVELLCIAPQGVLYSAKFYFVPQTNCLSGPLFKPVTKSATNTMITVFPIVPETNHLSVPPCHAVVKSGAQ